MDIQDQNISEPEYEFINLFDTTMASGKPRNPAVPTSSSVGGSSSPDPIVESFRSRSLESSARTSNEEELARDVAIVNHAFNIGRVRVLENSDEEIVALHARRKATREHLVEGAKDPASVAQAESLGGIEHDPIYTGRRFLSIDQLIEMGRQPPGEGRDDAGVRKQARDDAVKSQKERSQASTRTRISP